MLQSSQITVHSKAFGKEDNLNRMTRIHCMSAPNKTATILYIVVSVNKITFSFHSFLLQYIKYNPWKNILFYILFKELTFSDSNRTVGRLLILYKTHLGHFANYKVIPCDNKNNIETTLLSFLKNYSPVKIDSSCN